MKSRTALLTLALFVAIGAQAAEEEAPKSRMKEVLKARVEEQAKNAPAKPASPASTSATPTSPSPTAPAPTTPAKDAPVKDAPPAEVAAKTAKETPTVLPKVEVRKDRITEIDRQIFLQEKEIAREKKNLKQTEADKALNDPRAAKALAIFGGQSSGQRASLASERVSLMEEEKDLLEAMRYAKTKEAKAELQKQLDELRAVRRELEKSLR